MRNWIFMNKEHGHVLTYSEMIEEFRAEYDGDDPTNPISWEEYYTVVEW